MSIFTFFEAQIDASAAEYIYQANLIRELVINPLRGNVGLVLAGHWLGQGANRFVDDMNDEILPMLEGLLLVNLNLAGGIKKSEELMDNAIQVASAQSASLMDDYLIIF